MLAIVLKKSVFAEGSEIVSFFSRDLGRIRAIARSVKSPKSKLAFGLQTLFLVEVEFAKSTKNFLVTGVRPLEAFMQLRENENAVNNALLATELLLKSTGDEQPNEKLFDLFLGFLRHLNFDSNQKHFCGDFFVISALGLNGYQVDSKKCVLCSKDFVDAEEMKSTRVQEAGQHFFEKSKVFFSNRKGGFVCESCAKSLAA